MTHQLTIGPTMLAEPRWAQVFAAAKRRGAKWADLADVRAYKTEIEAAIAASDGAKVASSAPEAASSPPYTKPISLIDATLLKIACPENKLADLELWVEPTRAACKRWGIDTLREIASFLANIGVESAGLTRLSENMNYSAKRLTQIWPSRFPNLKAAAPYANNPEKLANRVYANRMGNGPPESGDGWRYRGYGPKQLTGKHNHSRFAEAAGIPLAEVPAYIQTREGGMMSAGWYWFDNGLDAKAATAGIEDDRKAINGGLIGVDDVRNRFNALIAELLKREKL